jgi:multidrug resistance efflux pump
VPAAAAGGRALKRGSSQALHRQLSDANARLESAAAALTAAGRQAEAASEQARRLRAMEGADAASRVTIASLRAQLEQARPRAARAPGGLSAEREPCAPGEASRRGPEADLL